MVLRHTKGDNSFPLQCANRVYIVRNLTTLRVFATKNKEGEQMKNVNDDEDYAVVMQNETHSKNICK